MLIFLSATYEIRVTLLVLIFSSLFTFLRQGNHFFAKNNLRFTVTIVISMVAGLIPHSIWIIPILLSKDIKPALDGASHNPFNSFYGILDVFTLHTYSWVGNLVREPFYKQLIEARFFLIPIVSFIGALNIRRYTKIKNAGLISFFSAVLLFIILLGKQSNIPFKNIYDWMFYNIPLFNVYRESSKFFIFLALTMSMFFGFGIVYIYQVIHRKIIATTAIITILIMGIIFNTQHFIDQKIGYMTKGVEISKDYSLLSETISNDKEFGRLLWIPVRPRFGFYSSNHPNVNSIDLVQQYNNIIDVTASDSSSSKYSKIILNDNLRFALDKLSIKYIIFPLIEKNQKLNKDGFIENTFESYEYYGSYPEYYGKISEIKLPKYNDGQFNALIIYENPTSRPHLYTSDESESYLKNLSYKNVWNIKSSPVQYEFKVSTTSASTFLYFTDSYSSSWKISVKGANLISGLFDRNYFISDKYHIKTDLSLNSYYLNLQSLCKSTKCEIDSDGNTVIKLYLTYTPEEYVQLGKYICIFGLLIYSVIIFKIKGNGVKTK